MRATTTLFVPSVLFLLGAARADVFDWNDPSGGSLHDPANWDDGESGLPGYDDELRFDLEAAYFANPAQYQPVTHAFLVVRRGAPTIRSLGSHVDFDFHGAGAATPAVVVADAPGAAAHLQFLDIGGTLGLDLRIAGLRIAAASGSSGSWTHVGGRRIVEAGDVQIGWLGSGSANFGQGANVSIGRLDLASGVDADGMLDVDGPDTLVAAGAVVVGIGGDGDMQVRNGGELRATSMQIASGATACGSVVVEGAGSRVLLDDGLDVGWFGDASVEARDGAGIAVFGSVTIGGFAHDDPPTTWAHGSMRLCADATLFAGGSLYLGFGGEAVLECAAGGSAWILGDVLSFSDGTAGGARIEVQIVDSDDAVGSPAVFVAGAAHVPIVSVRFDEASVPVPGAVHRLVRALGGIEVGTLDLAAPPGFRLEPILDDTDVAVRVVLTADLDGDGAVGFADLTILLADWGSCAPPPSACAADLDGDGSVDFADLIVLLARWSA